MIWDGTPNPTVFEVATVLRVKGPTSMIRKRFNLGFWGSGFRVQGFRVQGLGFRVQGLNRVGQSGIRLGKLAARPPGLISSL